MAVVASVLAAPSAIAGPRTDHIPYDQTPLLANREPPKQKYEHGIYPSGNPDGVGDSVDPPLHDGVAPDLVLTLYDFSSDPTQSSPDGTHEVAFWKEYSGTHADIYIGWNDLTAPSSSSQQDHVITSEQIAYIGEQFDQRIWESDVFHFGSYLPRCPGEDPGNNSCGDGDRAAILVYNIRDDAYWTEFRFYIAGFFWGGLNDVLGVNAVFVDSFNWVDRLGEDAARPLLYEGTVAHEFQHLIHNDVDPNEDSFIDEGMADLAEQFIYGTRTTDSHIGEYLFFHRDSLTDWDGELYDYGNAVLWQDYLWEYAGGDDLDAPLAARLAAGHGPFEESVGKFADPGDAFVWNLIHEQDNGLQGVADHVGGMANVAAIHRDFTLANLLDGQVSEPQWNYQSLVLGSEDSDNLTIDDGIAFYESNVNGNMPPTRKNVRRRTVVEPWGAYYRTFGGASPGFAMSFEGNATDGVAAFSPPTQWYSGLGNELERSLEKTVTVGAGDTLTFQTWFDIEEDWDFGYVEASADGGTTWTKLDQLTSLREGVTNITGSSAWDGPGGLTGSSGGWQQAEYDFGGLTGAVIVRFRYATDEAVNGQGWYVDDVQVGSGPVDTIDSTAGWTTDGWIFSTGLQENAWTADVFAPFAKALTGGYDVFSLALTTTGNTTSGSVFVPLQFKKSGKAYGIVANRPLGVFDATGRLTVLKGK
jgi:hypothetical protein